MKIKYRVFTIHPVDIEDRINEELKGWRIKKIIHLSIKVDSYKEIATVELIGEVDE